MTKKKAAPAVVPDSDPIEFTPAPDLEKVVAASEPEPESGSTVEPETEARLIGLTPTAQFMPSSRISAPRPLPSTDDELATLLYNEIRLPGMSGFTDLDEGIKIRYRSAVKKLSEKLLG